MKTDSLVSVISFLIIILFSCQRNQQPADHLPASILEWENAQIKALADRLNSERYLQKPPNIFQLDTVYLLEIHARSGENGQYTLIFPDSKGYSVWSEQPIRIGFGEVLHGSMIKKNIGAYEWNGLNNLIKNSGFWEMKLDFASPRDAQNPDFAYRIWVKQGDRYKISKWESTSQDPRLVLATKILALGGLPDNRAEGSYTEKNDSLKLRIRQFADTFFVKSRCLEYGGRQFPIINGSVSFMTLKMGLYDVSPGKFWLKQIWRDGTEERKMITTLHKATSDVFDKKSK